MCTSVDVHMCTGVQSHMCTGLRQYWPLEQGGDKYQTPDMSHLTGHAGLDHLHSRYSLSEACTHILLLNQIILNSSLFGQNIVAESILRPWWKLKLPHFNFFQLSITSLSQNIKSVISRAFWASDPRTRVTPPRWVTYIFTQIIAYSYKSF